MNCANRTARPTWGTTKRSRKMLVNVGKGIEKTIEPNDLPAAALAHVVMIGLRNVLMDSHASVTTEEYPDANERKSVAEAMVDKKLAALMAGDVRVQSTREGDPVRAEAIRMATAQIRALIHKAGKRVSDYKPADIRAKAVERVTPELLATAKARVEQLKATVPATETLADIGL